MTRADAHRSRARPTPRTLALTRQLGSATDSLALVARVLALASQPGEDALAYALAAEARAAAAAARRRAAVAARPDGSPGSPARAARSARARGEPRRGDRARGVRLRTRARCARRGRRAVPGAGPRAGRAARPHARDGRRVPARVLLSPARRTSSTRRRSSSAHAFAGAAAAAFAHQATAARAPRTRPTSTPRSPAPPRRCNESLDLSTLLGRICQEARDADRRRHRRRLPRAPRPTSSRVEAAHGLPPEHARLTACRPGAGLAGKVLLEPTAR